MELTKEQLFSLKLDDFVKEINNRLRELSKEAEEFNIGIDLSVVQYMNFSQVRVAKEYLLKEDEE